MSDPRNDMSGTAHNVVQAGAIHGGVHFHAAPADGRLSVWLSAYREGGGLRYRERREAGRLLIAPEDDYLDLLRSGGLLVPQHYWLAMWQGRFAWPVLDVRVTNNTGRTTFFHEARLTVADSHTDLRPVPVLREAHGPHVSLGNVGWGPMLDCVLRGHLERQHDPTPLTEEFTLRCHENGGTEDNSPLLAALASVGVDVAQVGNDRREHNLAGQERAAVLGPFAQDRVAVVAGILEYTQTELDGSRSRRVHPLRTLIRFSEPRDGAAVPPTCTYQARLRADGRDYAVSVPISQALAAGEADRFLITLAAERSSWHDLSLSLRYDDEEELDCGSVGLELFISTEDAYWQSQPQD